MDYLNHPSLCSQLISHIAVAQTWTHGQTSLTSQENFAGSLQPWPYVVEHVGNRSDIYAGSPAFAPFAPPPATPHAAPPPAAVPLPFASPPAAPAAPPASAGGFCYGSWTREVYYEAKGSRFRSLCTFSVVLDEGPGAGYHW